MKKENLTANERKFYDDCVQFYLGKTTVNPTVSNMTVYGVPYEAALAITKAAEKATKQKQKPATLKAGVL